MQWLWRTLIVETIRAIIEAIRRWRQRKNKEEEEEEKQGDK